MKWRFLLISVCWLALVGSSSATSPKRCMAEALRKRAAAAAAGQVEGLLAVVLDYQRLAGKEAREDRRAAQLARKAGADGKAAKLGVDQQAIDQQMAEAEQKADAAMSAATIAMTTGIVSAAASVASAAAAGAGAGAAPEEDVRASALARGVDQLKANLTAKLAAVKSGGQGGLSAAEVQKVREQLEETLRGLIRSKDAPSDCP